MSVGASMAGGNPTEGREDDDFYQTEEPATHALMRFLMQRWYREQGLEMLNIWEPACGKGRMVNVFMDYPKITGNIISTDLVDRGFGTGGIDFLQVTELPKTKSGVYDTIITNQPFDQTFEFFQHARLLGAQRIVFLMKAQYWHTNWQKPPFTSREMWKGWAPSWWLPMTWRLQFKDPEKLAKMDKKPAPTMDTAWCVWDRHAQHDGCLMVPLQKPIGIEAE